jgi:hypothetical protein
MSRWTVSSRTPSTIFPTATGRLRSGPAGGRDAVMPAHGGSAYPAILVPSAAVRFDKGQTTYNPFPSGVAASKQYGFCPDCGTPVDAKIQGNSDIWCLAAGGFDDPSKFRPTMELFLSRARSWMPQSPDLQKFGDAPPP